MTDQDPKPPEPTVEGKTFAEWVELLSPEASPEQAITIAGLKFGGGDDCITLDEQGRRIPD